MYNVVVHMLQEEPIEGEIEQLPAPNANFIAIHNPRKRNGKDPTIEWIHPSNNTLLIPFNHIMGIEIGPRREGEEIVRKYRHDQL
jgi:hypothetical protein